MQLCNKPVRKAANGVDRGFCTRPVKHKGRHANSTCAVCGIIKNRENAFPGKQISGPCKKCAYAGNRKEKIDNPAERLRRKEQLSAGGRKGGAVAVATGQILQIRSTERSRRGGRTSGFLHLQNGTGIFAPGMAERGGIIGAHNRWHVEGKAKIPECILCVNPNALDEAENFVAKQ
jgi:hypothetical protein